MKTIMLSLLLLLNALNTKAQLNYYDSPEELQQYAESLLKRHAKFQKTQFVTNTEEITEFANKLNIIMGQMGIIGQHLAFDQKEILLRKRLIEAMAIKYGKQLSIELVNDAYTEKKQSKSHSNYISQTTGTQQKNRPYSRPNKHQLSNTISYRKGR